MWKFGNLTATSGQKIKGYLEFDIIQEKLPVFLINGEEDGPTVLILGGIHGCEYTSIDAALELGKKLEPKDTKGQLAIIPISNPAAFYSRSIYVHPDDQKNLNRVFPGKKDGTASERLAYCINETAIKQVDYVIDLHGGDMIEALVPFTIYQVLDDHSVTEKSRELASLFGIDYVVGSTGQVGGSTYGSAAQQGKVALIAEAGQQGILDPKQSYLLQKGTKNVLRSIGAMEGEVSKGNPKLLDVFDWYFAETSGLWYPNVEIGGDVKKGDYLGKITNEFGETVQEYYSKSNGVILFLVSSLAMNPQNPLLAIGD